MINAWHLAWIVPLSGAFGLFLAAILQCGDCDPVWFDDDHDVSGLIDED